MKARSSGLVLAVVVAVLAALGSTTPRAASAATSCASTQWSADFFGGTALAGTPLVSRCDAAVAFDWGVGSPAAGVPADQFSARWTRTDTFNAGSYTFTATGDDGLRIKVDGMTVVDGWHDQAATTYTGTTTVTAGAHTVVVEYYEAYGNASMSASYAPATAAAARRPPPPERTCSATPTCRPARRPRPASSTAAGASGPSRQRCRPTCRRAPRVVPGG